MYIRRSRSIIVLEVLGAITQYNCHIPDCGLAVTKFLLLDIKKDKIHFFLWITTSSQCIAVFANMGNDL